MLFTNWITYICITKDMLLDMLLCLASVLGIKIIWDCLPECQFLIQFFIRIFLRLNTVKIGVWGLLVPSTGAQLLLNHSSLRDGNTKILKSVIFEQRKDTVQIVCWNGWLCIIPEVRWVHSSQRKFFFLSIKDCNTSVTSFFVAVMDKSEKRGQYKMHVGAMYIPTILLHWQRIRLMRTSVLTCSRFC